MSLAAELETALARLAVSANPSGFVELAKLLRRAGCRGDAAAVLDRGFGTFPEEDHLRDLRAGALEELAVEVGGIRFRYVPGGRTVLGSELGELDERPVLEAMVAAFRIAETPVTWEQYARVMGWDDPPDAFPPDPPVSEGGTAPDLFLVAQENKIRRHYCLAPGTPLVAVGASEAEEWCARLAKVGGECEIRLPREDEWERAARGGLLRCRYPWGDAAPTRDRADFGNFSSFAIGPLRDLPPNGYGLFAMCGSVWEWTSEPYDALALAHRAERSRPDGVRSGTPSGIRESPASGERAVRGGSWADGPEMVTVSARMSWPDFHWRWENVPLRRLTPNIGFRPVLLVVGPGEWGEGPGAAVRRWLEGTPLPPGGGAG